MEPVGLIDLKAEFRNRMKIKMVPRPRIELGTQGFSVLCSTD